MDVNSTYHGNYFTTYVSQTITLCSLSYIELYVNYSSDLKTGLKTRVEHWRIGETEGIYKVKGRQAPMANPVRNYRQ